MGKKDHRMGIAMTKTGPEEIRKRSPKSLDDIPEIGLPSNTLTTRKKKEASMRLHVLSYALLRATAVATREMPF